MPISPKAQIVDDSPSQKMVRESRPKKTVVDSNGRTIVYRPMSILDQAKLYRAVGAEASRNPQYMNLINIAAAVITIDGEFGPMPTTLEFAEMRVNWVGDDGYVVILDEIDKQIAERQREQSEKERDAEFRDEVKN